MARRRGAQNGARGGLKRDDSGYGGVAWKKQTPRQVSNLPRGDRALQVL
jgi:hypothetical protein